MIDASKRVLGSGTATPNCRLSNQDEPPSNVEPVYACTAITRVVAALGGTASATD